jgi:hypothetical protein
MAGEELLTVMSVAVVVHVIVVGVVIRVAETVSNVVCWIVEVALIVVSVMTPSVFRSVGSSLVIAP